ncbi:hypothetical protein EJ06DRAFT_584518 [Trichodelitschia bisporula]|uniref:Uncharacterized protein n=1 Tax=Trichodelitschia bisporula TaxID=703511 RepID=A0A6G1HNK4_9PEZI|nr:hypothetical protein EJ06DRAFT_584518 [Trichodelitschia bisporula]
MKTDLKTDEIIRNSDIIGLTLVTYARSSSNPSTGNPALHIRCRERHPWARTVYDEWPHRLIRLRDALLPFENFAELSACPFRQLLQRRRVPPWRGHHAREGPDGPDLQGGGYGFQYAHGTVLPAFLSGSASRNLLRYHPAFIDTSQTARLPVGAKQWYETPRVEIAHSGAPSGLAEEHWPAAVPVVRSKLEVGSVMGPDCCGLNLRAECARGGGIRL